MINRFQFRAGAIMAAIYAAVCIAFLCIAGLGGGQSEVHSDIPALKRAFNDPNYGLLTSALIIGTACGIFGFFHGKLGRDRRQTRLLAASNPIAPSHIRRKVRHRFWDIHVHKLNADGTDMLKSKS